MTAAAQAAGGAAQSTLAPPAARSGRQLAVAFGIVAAAAGVATPALVPAGHVLNEDVWALLVLAWTVAGTAALLRRPSERHGTLVLCGAAVGGLAAVSSAVLAGAAYRHVGADAISAARLTRTIAVALLPIVIMHLMLGLPDGACRFSRAAILSGYVVGTAVGIAMWAQRPAVRWWPLAVEALVAIPVGAFGSQHRYQRSHGVERQRMQWFGWALAVGVELLLVAVALRLLWGWPTRIGPVPAAASVPIPIAIIMGSSRRFATRIDRILAHTVSIAGLTGVVVSSYLVVVIGLGRTPTHAERSLLALSMAAAAMAALLYSPARERLSQYANRVVYGEREPPDVVLRAFGSRLSRAVPMDELLLQVAESLSKTLGLASAEVWTGSGGRLERSVSVPQRPIQRLLMTPDEEAVVARAGVTGAAWVRVWLPVLLEDRAGMLIRVAPATHSGRVLGLIVVLRPATGDAFAADDESMLRELARQVGLALHNVELDSALQASLNQVRRQADELQASRARIVAAADAARRKIERDLHDGAQQHLVALAVNLRLARQLAEADPAASGEILDAMTAELQVAVQELRALAHGIYPPLLVDRGIDEALRSAAARAALPAMVEADSIGRYAPEVEAAVYFCCMEALQNAGKHAGPDATATVRVWEEAGGLLFAVRDTGVGFDTTDKRGRGAGFVNMNDRVGAIGGTVSVESSPGRGTVVSGRISIAG